MKGCLSPAGEDSAFPDFYLVDRYRLPTMLKLTLKDFTVNRFMGATLRVADWEALQRDLRRAGVKS